MNRVILWGVLASILWVHCDFQTTSNTQSPDTTVHISEEASEPLSRQDSIRQMGNRLTNKLQQQLMTILIRQIRNQGMKSALQYCTKKALPIMDTFSQQSGLNIQRVSHRPRNPQNRANRQEKEVIRQYIQQQKAREELKPEILATDSPQHYTYFSPIIIKNTLCLKCHGYVGKDIASRHYRLIKQAYPSDSATGFSMNDIRGLWRIDFQKQALP